MRQFDYTEKCIRLQKSSLKSLIHIDLKVLIWQYRTEKGIKLQKSSLRRLLYGNSQRFLLRQID